MLEMPTLRTTPGRETGVKHIGASVLAASLAVTNWDRALVYAVGAAAVAIVLAVIVALVVAHRARKGMDRLLELARGGQFAAEQSLDVARASQRVAEDALNVAIEERVAQRRANLTIEAESHAYGALGDLIHHRAVMVNNGPNIARQVRVARSLDAVMRLYLRQRETEQRQGASERSEVADEVAEVETLAPNQRVATIGLVPDLDSGAFSTITISWMDGNGEHSQTKRVPLA